MKEEALRKFGLSDREIRVYLALLELGEALASKIAEKPPADVGGVSFKG